MNKKQRDKKNKKRAIKVSELTIGEHTSRYVDVRLTMTIGGKVYGQKRFHYRRGRETPAFDMEQLTQIICGWEKTVGFGSTSIYEFLTELDGKISNRNGLTPRQLTDKYWVHAKETWEADFDRKNKGIPGELWAEAENDYLRNMTGIALDTFFQKPMPCKMAFLYGLFKIGYSKGGYEEFRQDIEQTPQYIKDIVDGMIDKED